MRRKVLPLVVVFMVLVPALPAVSFSYRPSFSVNGGMQFDRFSKSLESSGNFSSVLFFEGKLTAIGTFRIGERWGMALPVYASWAAPGRLSARTEKQEEAAIGAELEAEVRLTDRFIITAGGGLRLHCYLESLGWYVSYGGTLTLCPYPLVVPISIYAGANGMTFRAGIGLRLGAR